DRCDLVATGSDATLVRLSGPPTQMSEVELQLYVPLGGAGELIAPLPPGTVVSEDGRWSAAFAVAKEAVGERLALVPTAGAPIAFTPDDGRSARTASDVRLTRALEDLADAEALAEQFRRRCALSERALSEFRDKLVQAWAEAAELRSLLDSRESAHEIAKRRERDAVDVVDALEERARQAQEELTARRIELEEQCGFLHAELGRRDAAGAGAQEELAAAEERFQQLQARSSDALERFEEARSEADQLRTLLSEAEALAVDAADATERAARELVEQRAKTDEASHLADVHSERLAKAERELSEARAELDATRKQLADGPREAATPAQATTEADLRHLLAVTQRDLDEARVALNEQRARYAAVASEAAWDSPALHPADDDGAQPPERPWTAVDEDLLSRIARAQEFAARN
ncbi:MAG: hypothetical protein QOE38_885, partial [Thermoleophilaceae bacterium]|nr:hypothetical protein [Thermoleophilaceae bacterium]